MNPIMAVAIDISIIDPYSFQYRLAGSHSRLRLPAKACWFQGGGDEIGTKLPAKESRSLNSGVRKSNTIPIPYLNADKSACVYSRYTTEPFPPLTGIGIKTPVG